MSDIQAQIQMEYDQLRAGGMSNVDAHNVLMAKYANSSTTNGGSSGSGARGLAGLYGAYKGAEALMSGGGEAATEVGSAMTADGLPGVLMSDGSVVAAGEGASTLGSYVVPGLGAAAGLAGMYKASQLPDKKTGMAVGGLSGAVAGASIGTMLGGPGIGTGIGALVGLGAGALAHKSTKQREAERWAGLDQNTTGLADYYAKTKANEEAGLGNVKGKVNNSVGSDFVGIDPKTGAWTNNKFASSRNVADLRAEDIWGSQDFFNAFGNDWLGKYSEADRRKVADAELAAGNVDDKEGGTYFKDDAKAKQIGLDALANKSGVGTTQTGVDQGRLVKDDKAQSDALAALAKAQGAQISAYSNQMASANKMAEEGARKQKLLGLAGNVQVTGKPADYSGIKFY